MIYAPTGYTAVLAQAAGTQVGTVEAQVQVREPIAGAVLPLTGTITAASPAAYTANQCAPGTHAAVWLLSLQAAGQTLTVPVYVDQTVGTETAIGAYKLTVCLPSPNIPASAGGATFGAKLILAQLNFSQGVFTTPINSGTFRWHMLATPWPATAAGPPNAAGTVAAQGRVGLPARVTLRATSKKGRVTITGSVLEATTGVNRASRSACASGPGTTRSARTLEARSASSSGVAVRLAGDHHRDREHPGADDQLLHARRRSRASAASARRCSSSSRRARSAFASGRQSVRSEGLPRGPSAFSRIGP